MHWILLVLAIAWRPLCTARRDSSWSIQGVEPFLLSQSCNVDRIPREALEEYIFEAIYLDKKPVIIVGADNAAFQTLTTKERLLEDYGDVEVLLSSANTISREKKPMLFKDYVLSMVPQQADQMGNETFYLFGPENEISKEFGRLMSHYKPPFFSGDDLAFSFGIGPSGSGVPFHFHGHGFSEVLHGQKRWLLYPPQHVPDFHPNRSSTDWLKNNYPGLKGKSKDNLHDCTIKRGEVLYFPGLWWHATVNIGETVFVSSFDGRQPSELSTSLTNMLERMWRGSFRTSSAAKEL